MAPADRGFEESTRAFVVIGRFIRQIVFPNRDDVHMLIKSLLDQWTGFVHPVRERGDSVIFATCSYIAYSIYFYSAWIRFTLHMMLLPLVPIIIGAHSSLSRPPSAGPPILEEEDDEEEDNQVGQPIPPVAAMTTWDAIIAPAATGVYLTIVVLLMKLLGRDLFGRIVLEVSLVFNFLILTRFLTETLDTVLSFVFPSKWHSKRTGTTYFVDPSQSQQFVSSSNSPNKASVYRRVANDRTNPLAGPLSGWTPLKRFGPWLWSIRALFTQRYHFKFYVRKTYSSRSYWRLNDVLGYGAGLVITALWRYSHPKIPWALNNFVIVAWGAIAVSAKPQPGKFSLKILSSALTIVYDVVMVYYTGMIPLVVNALKGKWPTGFEFPGPRGRSAFTGLGDIVVPGLMIAFALRFDFYLYYLRKQTVVTDETSLKARLRSRTRTTFSEAPLGVTRVIKAPYVNVTGQWGEWFWTLGAPQKDRVNSFPKVYFWACMYGYVFGMVATDIVGTISHAGQPALLMLVPSVILFGGFTALWRGELGLMGSYSEVVEDGDKISPGSKSRKSSYDGGKSSYPFIEEQSRQSSIDEDRRRKNSTEDLVRHVYLISLTKSKRKHKTL